MRIFMYLIAAMMLVGCEKKEERLVFGELPEARMKEQLDALSAALTGAEYGWKAHLTTGFDAGYGFYMNFSEDQKVSMVADLNANVASDVGTSSYRLKYIMKATLIFDTYNYITLLQDPDGSVYDGVDGAGNYSDIEFELDSVTSDSIYLTGKKYQHSLVMVKATSDEAVAYTSGKYETAITKTDEFVAENSNPFIELTVGGYTSSVQFSLDNYNKVVGFTGMLEDGEIGVAETSFFYTLDGIEPIGGLTYNGVTFTQFKWKDATAFAGYDDKGNEYVLSNSVSPILPLYRLFGVKYSGLRSPYLSIFPGTNAAGAEILNFFHQNLANRYTGYVFNSGYINLSMDVVNKRLRFDGASSQSNGVNHWLTTIYYDYTVDENGVYKFVLRSPAAGGYTASIMTKMDAFIQNNQIIFDYYVENGNLYGKMSDVDGAVVMTFLLQ